MMGRKNRKNKKKQTEQQPVKVPEDVVMEEKVVVEDVIMEEVIESEQVKTPLKNDENAGKSQTLMQLVEQMNLLSLPSAGTSDKSPGFAGSSKDRQILDALISSASSDDVQEDPQIFIRSVEEINNSLPPVAEVDDDDDDGDDENEVEVNGILLLDEGNNQSIPPGYKPFIELGNKIFFFQGRKDKYLLYSAGDVGDSKDRISEVVGISEDVGASEDVGISEDVGASKDVGVSEAVATSEDVGISEENGASEDARISENVKYDEYMIIPTSISTNDIVLVEVTNWEVEYFVERKQPGSLGRYLYEYYHEPLNAPSNLLVNTYSDILTTLNALCCKSNYDILIGKVRPEKSTDFYYEVLKVIDASIKFYNLNHVTNREVFQAFSNITHADMTEDYVLLHSSWKLTIICLDVLVQLTLCLSQKPDPGNEVEVKERSNTEDVLLKLNIVRLLELITSQGIHLNLNLDLEVDKLPSIPNTFLEGLANCVVLSKITRMYRLAYIMDAIFFTLRSPLIFENITRVFPQIMTGSIEMLSSDPPELTLDTSDDEKFDKAVASSSKKLSKTGKRKAKKLQQELQIKARELEGKSKCLEAEQNHYAHILALQEGLHDHICVYILMSGEIQLTTHSSLKRQVKEIFTTKLKIRAIKTMIKTLYLQNPNWFISPIVTCLHYIFETEPSAAYLFITALHENWSAIHKDKTLIIDGVFRDIRYSLNILAELHDKTKTKPFLDALAFQISQLLIFCSEFETHRKLLHEDDIKYWSDLVGGEPIPDTKLYFKYAMLVAYYFTTYHPNVCGPFIWNDLYRDWFVLPASIPVIIDMIKLSEALLLCCEMSTLDCMKHFRIASLTTLFKIWRAHLMTYVATKHFINENTKAKKTSDLKPLYGLDYMLGQVILKLLEIFNRGNEFRLIEVIERMPFEASSKLGAVPNNLVWARRPVPADPDKTEIKLYKRKTKSLICTTVEEKTYLFNSLQNSAFVLIALLQQYNAQDFIHKICVEIMEDEVESMSSPFIPEVYRTNPANELETIFVNIDPTIDNCTSLFRTSLLQVVEQNLASYENYKTFNDGKSHFSILRTAIKSKLARQQIKTAGKALAKAKAKAKAKSKAKEKEK